jgi:hypothetical protein
MKQGADTFEMRLANLVQESRKLHFHRILDCVAKVYSGSLGFERGHMASGWAPTRVDSRCSNTVFCVIAFLLKTVGICL